MSEETKEVYDAKDISFFESVQWENVKFNSIPKDQFLRTRAKYKKLYATFLGPAEAPSFYMFVPLTWGMYKEIRSKGLDKHSINEYIINSCIVWPKMDPVEIMNEDSGIMLTLVYQIMAVSNFLSDPSKSLELIYEL
jgi:hypothetical protein